MDAVLYMRYSSHNQTEQSIEGQERVCRDYCERNSIRIVGSYIDRATSASKDTEKRIEFGKMLRDAAKQKWQAVVVYKLDRFARNRYDSAIAKNKLKVYGVRLISATEPIDDSPESIILESVLEGMAEYYSAELSQKIKRGNHETALKGRARGGCVPIGYDVVDGKYVINEREASVVKEIFTRYADGEPVASIVKDLNARGIRTKRGNEWGYGSFHGMFTNKIYYGVYDRCGVVLEGVVEPIVSKELWDAVGERSKLVQKSHGTTRADEPYLLATKIFCGGCGGTMIGDCGTSKTGAKYHYYKCINRKNRHTCKMRSVPKEWIERAVVDDAISRLNDDTIDAIAKEAVAHSKAEAESAARISELKARREELAKSIDNLTIALASIPNSKAIHSKIAEFEGEAEKLDAAIDEAERNTFVLDYCSVVWWLSQFKDGNVDDLNFRRKVVDYLVHSVVVFDDGDGFVVEIKYNLSRNDVGRIKSSDDIKSAPSSVRQPNTYYTNDFAIVVKKLPYP